MGDHNANRTTIAARRGKRSRNADAVSALSVVRGGWFRSIADAHRFRERRIARGHSGVRSYLDDTLQRKTSGSFQRDRLN
jgi:hypothetical protein